MTAKNHTRRKRCAPQGHDNLVAAAFAPDGGRVLTASVNTAQLWDRDGKPLAILKGHMNFVVSAVFVPGGNSILTASDDNTAGGFCGSSKAGR